MEPKFNTSFIPKQSLQSAAPGPAVHEYVARRSTRGPGFYGTFLLFFIACLVSAGLFLYTQYITGAISDKIAQLKANRDAFQPALIEELVRLDDRMTSAKRLLETHVAPSEVLRFLEQNTTRSVRYLSLRYRNAPTDVPEKQVLLSLQGTAPDFKSVAQQSDVFSSHELVREPLFSNLNVSETDQAVFSASMSLEPRILRFDRTIGAAARPRPAAPAPAAVSSTSTATSSATSSAGRR